MLWITSSIITRTDITGNITLSQKLLTDIEYVVVSFEVPFFFLYFLFLNGVFIFNFILFYIAKWVVDKVQKCFCSCSQISYSQSWSNCRTVNLYVEERKRRGNRRKKRRGSRRKKKGEEREEERRGEEIDSTQPGYTRTSILQSEFESAWRLMTQSMRTSTLRQSRTTFSKPKRKNTTNITR